MKEGSSEGRILSSGGAKMMRRDGRSAVSARALAVLALAAALAGPTPIARAEDAKGGPLPQEVSSGSVTVRLHDVPLLDQDGRKVRFPGDVIGGRVVVIDTFFTTCGLICPILGAIFSDLQEQLGDRLDREVRLISITVDRALEGIGMYSPDFSAHPSAFLVGDGREGKWTRFNGFASPEQLKSRVEELLAERRGKAPAR